MAKCARWRVPRCLTCDWKDIVATAIPMAMTLYQSNGPSIVPFQRASPLTTKSASRAPHPSQRNNRAQSGTAFPRISTRHAVTLSRAAVRTAELHARPSATRAATGGTAAAAAAVAVARGRCSPPPAPVVATRLKCRFSPAATNRCTARRASNSAAAVVAAAAAATVAAAAGVQAAAIGSNSLAAASQAKSLTRSSADCVFRPKGGLSAELLGVPSGAQTNVRRA